MNIFCVSKKSADLLLYGTFAVLCQTVMIFLLVIHRFSTSTVDVVRHVYSPMLEYPIMSIVLLLGGAMLIDLCEKDLLKKGK